MQWISHVRLVKISTQSETPVLSYVHRDTTITVPLSAPQHPSSEPSSLDPKKKKKKYILSSFASFLTSCDTVVTLSSHYDIKF